MLKKRVLKRLLPLLFSFCCVFSGFLSVNAFAYSAEYHLYPKNVLQYYSSTSISEIQSRSYEMTKDDNNVYVRNFSGGGLTYNKFLVGDVFNNFSYPYDSSLFDYYVLGSFIVNYKNSSVVNSFDLTDIYLYENVNSNWVKLNTNSIINKSYNSNSSIYSFNFPLESFSDLSVFEFEFNPDVVYTDRADASVSFEVSVLAVAKDTSADSVQSIIAAINNQTGTLQGSIGQAADDVQQSIEDQYSGEPEEEFSVDDVITQHNEKMGVLSFGSDVMLQFLDMFQSANVGTAELTLPGFNITVENVEYSVWPDYSFNFEQLNEWVPALMSVIRVMLPAFVWLMVLRYCIKVFEDNFLAK